MGGLFGSILNGFSQVVGTMAGATTQIVGTVANSQLGAAAGAALPGLLTGGAGSSGGLGAALAGGLGSAGGSGSGGNSGSPTFDLFGQILGIFSGGGTNPPKPGDTAPSQGMVAVGILAAISLVCGAVYYIFKKK